MVCVESNMVPFCYSARVWEGRGLQCSLKCRPSVTTATVHITQKFRSAEDHT